MLKNSKAMFASVALLAAAAAGPARAESMKIFTGVDFGPDSYFAYIGGVGALSGRDMDTYEGWLLSGSAGFGEYDYRTALVPGTRVEGDLVAADAMLGRNFLFNGGSLRLFGGGSYENHDLSPVDPGNAVNDGETGFKGQAELRFSPLASLAFEGIGSYSTAHDTYWTRFHLGYDFGPATIGPEAAFLGNEEYDQRRLGVAVYGLDMGFAQASLYGGVAASEGRRDDGAYGGLGLSKSF